MLTIAERLISVASTTANRKGKLQLKISQSACGLIAYVLK
jgi:hypothetical protein